MATNTATKAGNYNDTTVWSLGHAPIAGEDIDLAGFTVTANIARIPASGTLGNITSLSGGVGTAGKLTGAVTTFTSIYCADVNPANVGGACIEITGIAAGGFTFSAANVYGGDVASNIALYRNTSGTTPLTITGATLFKGGTAANAQAFKDYCTAGTLTINSGLTFQGGNASGAHGWNTAVNGSRTVSGVTFIGGDHASAYGWYSTSTSAATINDSTLTGATGVAVNQSASTPVIHACDLDFSGGYPFGGYLPTFTFDADNRVRWETGPDIYMALEPAPADLKDGVVCGGVTGELSSGGYGIL